MRRSHTESTLLKLRLARLKVLAPLLAAEAMENQFDTGRSQRRFA
jgi:hypothetical protein